MGRAERRSSEISSRGDAVRVDRERRIAEVHGRRVDLTPTEFQVLAALVGRTGRVGLLETVRGVGYRFGE